VDLLKDTIESEKLKVSRQKCCFSLALTCLDQLNGSLDYYLEGKLKHDKPEEAIKNIFRYLEIKKGYLVNGPSRDKVKVVEF
jgi:hypothetical protein